MRIAIRQETPADHRAVEELTREAFWGMSGPGCEEHLLVHRLRKSAGFVPELDLVAEVDGALAGHVIYSRARVVASDRTWEVLTFGPLSVHPEHQGTGVGTALMRHSMDIAARLGHRAVVVYGHPDYYPRLGFVRGAEVGITAPGGATFDALMVCPLLEDGLDGVHGEFHEDAAFRLDPADVAAFDLSFPPKTPATLQPIDTRASEVPAVVLDALRARGVVHVQDLGRYSSAEAEAWEHVGPAGRESLQTALRSRGVPWGMTAGDRRTA